MGKILSKALILLAAAAGALAAPEWETVPDAGTIVFSGTQVAGAFQGTLPVIAGHGCFDPVNPGAASATFAFDLARATTGIRDRDDIMRAPEWLAVEAFPAAAYSVSAIRATGANSFEAEGTLTLKGQSRPLPVPFTATVEDGALRVSGEFSIDRRDFNIGEGPWGETEKWVGFPVKVAFNLTAQRARTGCGG